MPVTIAVVDDDEAILDSIRLVLEEQGWDVQTYTTGEEFLAKLSRHQPDCIVLDPQLLGMSGAEVARSISNSNALLPIIGLTARPESPVTLDVINAGARVMLTKPVTAEELVDQIQSAISGGGQ